MLKHLKLKAAKLQDRPAVPYDGDDLSCQDTEIGEHLKKDDVLNQRTQENLIHSTTLPYTTELETAKSFCETYSKDATAISSGSISENVVRGTCYAQTSDALEGGHFSPGGISRMKLITPPNIHTLHSTYNAICQDPNCNNCSPPKLFTHHSPNMEGNCSCVSCLHQTSLPQVMHHNPSASYLHPVHVVESSPHMDPPGSGIFCSPQHSYLPQKPFFPSPYHHEWSKFASRAYNASNSNHSFSNPFHMSNPQKLPSSLWYSPYKQEYRHGVGHGLSLPLARSTIVSLLKGGRCDTILHLLDAPLHNECSPLYPIALNTVLEVLDVVEKEFATAYTSDSKIKGDIHQLANFVKSMTNASVSSVPEGNVSQRGGDEMENLEDDSSEANTFNSPAAKEQEGLVSETSEVNVSELGSSKSSPLDSEVETFVPTTEIASKVTTETMSDRNAEKSVPNGMSTSDILVQTSCVPQNVPIGKDESKTSYEGKSKQGMIGLNLSNFDGNGVEKNIPLGCSSIDLKDDQETYPEMAIGSGAPQVEENANGSQKENVEQVASKSIFISNDSERPMPVLENEVELQKLFSGGESKNEIDDRPPDSDIDALLDQSLMEADQAKSKKMNKIILDKTTEDPSTTGSSNYRGKGYKVRAVSSSDKQVTKVKAPVKTFAQIREKNPPLIYVPHPDYDTTLEVDQKPVTGSVTSPNKDLNGNVIEVLKTSTEVKITNETPGVDTDGALREGTPELSRCPSNPLSPSCSDSLDSTDLKSLFGKTRVTSSITSVPNELFNGHGGIYRSGSSALSLLDQVRKLPMPKEPIKQGGTGRPLISKSFHGKLLIQKNSKDDPYPIPLEKTDSDIIPRDPRLSLSNLMESKVNCEFSLLHWEENQTVQNVGQKTTEFPFIQSVLNVRDPRIRRRISEDKNFSVLNESVPPLVGSSKPVPYLQIGENSSAFGKTRKSSVAEIVKENSCSVIESETTTGVSKDETPKIIPPNDSSKSSDLNDKNSSLQLETSKSMRSSLNEVQDCVKESTTLSQVDSSLVAKTLDNNCDNVVQNTEVGSSEQEQQLLKSAIHSIRKTGDIGQLKKKEIPEIASTVSSCNISEIDKMDTVISFREALDVLKGIKTELKNDMGKCGSKIENIGKDKVAKLCSKVKLLRQTCEVGLLSTEVQRKKASGTRFRDLCGLLEDHFILIADLTILGVWLKTWNTDVKDCQEGLPEFKKGVFIRRTVPCFKKLEKWLKNRYKLDGFENDKLFKLVSMISLGENGKRSRSRSSSTGSSKHKRKKVRSVINDVEKNKKKDSKRSEKPKVSSRAESPVKDDRKRSRSPSRKKCGPDPKRSKDGRSDGGKSKPDTPAVETSSDSDTSNEFPEQSPSTISGPKTPESEGESSASQETEETVSKHKGQDKTDSRGKKGKKSEGASQRKKSVSEGSSQRKQSVSEGSSQRKQNVSEGSSQRKQSVSEGSSQRKQSVSVNSGIQDIQEDMEEIKKSVLVVFRNRSTTSANRCLGQLTDISHKAHTQLEDENKTYTSLKNASKDTQAKFHDVIKGIQRIIVDCEILVYSLSSSASKVTARETKDKIWKNAQKSSHKPPYEEELVLFLSLRKTYLNSDLWRYIKTDVDDRIESLQKKCRSRGRDTSNQRPASAGVEYTAIELPTSWTTTTAVPCEQVAKQTRLKAPISLPVADYDRRHEVGYHGPGTPFSVDYHGGYIGPSNRTNVMELPNNVYTPPSNQPFARNDYHPNGAGLHDHLNYDWKRKYDDEYITWGMVRRNPITTDMGYDGRPFTPPPAM